MDTDSQRIDLPCHPIAWISANGNAVAFRNVYGRDGKAPGVEGTLRFFRFCWAFSLASTFVSCTLGVQPNLISPPKVIPYMDR
jgi:hypothetical protein